MGDEGLDWTPPHLLRVTPPHPSLPSRLDLLRQKGIAGFCCWHCLGEGGTPYLLHLQPCSKSPIPVPSQCNVRRGGRLKKKPPHPFPDQMWSLLGHGARTLCWVSSGTVLAEGRDATPGQAEVAGPSVKAGGRRAGGLQQDSPGGDGPLGTAVAARAGLSGGAGPSELSAESLLSCLLGNRPSGSKFCLVSRCHLQEPAPASKPGQFELAPVYKPGQSSGVRENLVLRNPWHEHGNLPWHHQSCCSPTAPLTPRPQDPSSGATRILARVRK